MSERTHQCVDPNKTSTSFFSLIYRRKQSDSELQKSGHAAEKKAKHRLRGWYRAPKSLRYQGFRRTGYPKGTRGIRCRDTEYFGA